MIHLSEMKRETKEKASDPIWLTVSDRHSLIASGDYMSKSVLGKVEKQVTSDGSKKVA